MKKILIIFTALFMFNMFAMNTFAYKHVRGYFKSNGTYVAPYYKTSPDSYKYNNWSTNGNYNPFTGKRGYR